jgi:hypothetical protein
MRRLRRALWAAVVIVGWVGAITAVTTISDELYIWAGVPLTVLAGALLDRWWALAIPSAVTALLFGYLVALDPSCSDCGEIPRGAQVMLIGVLFTVPATLAMGLGVWARYFARYPREPAAREEHA